MFPSSVNPPAVTSKRLRGEVPELVPASKPLYGRVINSIEDSFNNICREPFIARRWYWAPLEEVNLDPVKEATGFHDEKLALSSAIEASFWITVSAAFKISATTKSIISLAEARADSLRSHESP
jgi:hypothetical protein